VGTQVVEEEEEGKGDSFGWSFEWDGKSSKHIPFDWTGP
jgi:hypothetical protein